jgi:predicted methyltransferase
MASRDFGGLEPDAIVLSFYQARALLEARRAGVSRVDVSPDLGLTTVEAQFLADGARFPAGNRFPEGLPVAWEHVEQIAAAENVCFLVGEGGIQKIQRFSGLTNQLYSLMPTSGAPTMLISGIPMHRIKGTDPGRDTLEKIKAVRPVRGSVLDTATGLGYTAIQAAQTAERVITVELDPTALEIARLNPWSRGLFENPGIVQRLGDSYDVVQEFADGSFERVVHDPPTISLAGHLYSAEFYGELHRTMARGGRLFHYVGDPESRSGRSTTRGVMARLREAGFRTVVRRPRAFGVVAVK